MVINNQGEDSQVNNNSRIHNSPEQKPGFKSALRVFDDRMNAQDIRFQSVLNELDLFLYRAAHDLRRPVASIMGLVDLINQSDNSKDNIQLLGKISETAEVMDRLLTKFRMVNDIQDDELILGKINFERMFRHIRSSLGKYLDLHTCYVDIEFDEESPFINNDTLGLCRNLQYY